MCPFSRTLISINRQVKPNAEIFNVTVNNFLQFQLLRNANFISSFTFFVLPLSSDHFKKLQIDLAISLLLEPYQGQGHEKAYMIALPRCRPIQRALKYMEMKVRVLKKFAAFCYMPEIYIQSAPNNSNETQTFMYLGRAGRFWAALKLL